MNADSSTLVDRLVWELKLYLDKYALDSRFSIAISEDISGILEYSIPVLLSDKYSEWRWQGLDGVFVDYARKLSPDTIELAGTVILIDDQATTPFYMRLTLSHTHNSLLSYQINLGEPGGGHLGISGPPYISSSANKLIGTVGMRLESIQWKYSAGKMANLPQNEPI